MRYFSGLLVLPKKSAANTWTAGKVANPARSQLLNRGNEYFPGPIRV